MEANFLRYKGGMVESIALFCEANKFKAKGLRQEQKFDVRFREGLLEQATALDTNQTSRRNR
jgi:hypothetical protein